LTSVASPSGWRSRVMMRLLVRRWRLSFISQYTLWTFLWFQVLPSF
jgi:hypothetical protein